MAILLENTSFYFPTFMDFRGRIYPLPTYFTYQSSDLARSLLKFKNVEVENNNSNNLQDLNEFIKSFSLHSKDQEIKNDGIIDIDYIKIYLANV